MQTQSISINDLPNLCEGEIRLQIPLEYRRGSRRDDERFSINSAITNLKAIAALTGRADWSKQNVLDFGCGVKFTQALIQYDIDVRAYVGMDVFKGLIECLKDKVKLPNFHYYDVPFKNEMYNRNGVELTPDAELPGSINTYDLIMLQSVFTHLNPADFQALLHVLRRHAANDACLFFTCFIDNDMEHDFKDKVPDHPLLKASYKERYIREMLKEASWKPLSLNPPASCMQYHFVCEPL